ncbi:hypothetical protein Pan44_19900 [Caulifigura coniformis]|uniref:Uncharacterized protein n=1 Tax=Caulifigura coniformis TaxID=2527983 RepID=A0A517SCW3_9PLAN|nr:hypothetical protein Pan44_19900 [Caulifigura coniformis]
MFYFQIMHLMALFPNLGALWRVQVAMTLLFVYACCPSPPPA